MQGIDPKHLRTYVIRPALEAIGLQSEAAEELLLGTALQESLGGVFLHQGNNGPAVGIFQMEPRTHDDLWANYLAYRPLLLAKMQSLLMPGMTKQDQLAGNLFYAAAMARVLYLRAPDPLPQAGDIAAQAAFYKRWYNSPGGAATTDAYLAKWNAIKAA